jgi:hypothetical protein
MYLICQFMFLMYFIGLYILFHRSIVGITCNFVGLMWLSLGCHLSYIFYDKMLIHVC